MLKFILVILLSMFALLHPYNGILAQTQPWSSPGAVFQTDGWTFHVASVIDASGHLIAIWQYNPYKKLGADLALSDNDNDSLFVSRFDGRDWSPPMEVLLGQIASHRLSVVTTPDGLLHVFSQSSCLWYSQVLLGDVERTKSWSVPACLADGGYTWPAATVSADGRINLLYSTRDATSFYLISSDDSGTTWSSPQLVIQSVSSDSGLATPAMAEDSEGTLHLVWSDVPLPDGYPASAINYARSTDRGDTWSAPQQLAGPRQSQPTITTDQQGRIHVAWNGDAGNHGRYYVSSSDRGLAWNAVETVLEGRGGLQMPPALVVDETGVVHALFTDQDRVISAQRTPSGWSPPRELIGPASIQDTAYLGETDSVRLEIVNGNELHALYTRFNFGEILHQVREIDAPRVTHSLPTPTVAPGTSSNLQATTMPAQAPSPTPPLRMATSDLGAHMPEQQSSAQPLLISTGLVVLLIGMIVAIRTARHR